VRIAIDGTSWYNQRGFGRFTRDLLTALFTLDRDHEYLLFVDQVTELPDSENVNIVHVDTKKTTTKAAVAKDRRSVADLIRLGVQVTSCHPDIVFYPAVYSWFPVKPGLKVVVTLHDAIAEHYPQLIFPDLKSRMLWSLKTKLALLQCDRVLTVSMAAKREIVEYLHVDPNMISVISEGASPIFRQCPQSEKYDNLRNKMGIPLDSRLIVYVGGLAPHKNLDGFLGGFTKAKSKAGIKDVKLLLVGDFSGAGFHSNYSSLRRQVNEDPLLKDSVFFPGFVSDEDLVLLYNDALSAAMPSFSEGFGLPALESMCCGVPVLSSTGGSLPEVVGEGGLYYDPHDTDAICEAILKLCTDHALHEKLSQHALSQSKKFSWKKSAEQTISILENMGK